MTDRAPVTVAVEIVRDRHHEASIAVSDGTPEFRGLFEIERIEVDEAAGTVSSERGSHTQLTIPAWLARDRGLI